MDRNKKDAFQREAIAAERFHRKKHVMEIIHTFQDPASQRYCIVMPFYKCNLAETLKNRCQTKPGRWEKRAIRHVIEGTAAIHAQNIVHRDLKLENIMVTEKKGMVITDFGSSADWKTGQTLKANRGTSFYRAPEVI